MAVSGLLTGIAGTDPDAGEDWGKEEMGAAGGEDG